MRDGKLKRKLTRLIDFAAGNHSQWYRRLLPLYASERGKRLEEAIKNERKKALKRYGLCLGAALLLCGGYVLSSLKSDNMQTLSLEYEGVCEEIQLKQAKKQNPSPQSEQTMKQSEIETIFAETRRRISQEMLGTNESWQEVSGPLVFPQRTENGVYLKYETSDARRISDKGEVDGIGSEKGKEVEIRVTMLFENSLSRFSLKAMVVPPRTKEERLSALRLRAENIRKELADGSKEEILERERKQGIKIKEASDGEGFGMILISAVVLTVLPFFERFRETERKVKRRQKMIAEKLPLLMEQLILMMNAGLILSEALQRAAESFPEEAQEEGGLFWEIRGICQRAEQTKRPVTALLCDYAVESGVPELVRFSMMLADHVNRGSASLVRQLKTERGYAIEQQWKEKEGKCREMEVRLAGPLFLLLAVILMLATGPVWIGM